MGKTGHGQKISVEGNYIEALYRGSNSRRNAPNASFCNGIQRFGHGVPRFKIVRLNDWNCKAMVGITTSDVEYERTYSTAQFMFTIGLQALQSFSLE